MRLVKFKVSVPLVDSFFFRTLLPVLLDELMSLEMEGDRDLIFFLSDRIGELELDPEDRGLLEDPSGLEVSDFFEEKNLPLNTILFFLYYIL